VLLKDLTVPLLALLNAGQLKRILKLSFGDVLIENLWLPFFCVSTNLTRAELAVHRDGPVAKWVRASLSIPGILPPVLSSEGDLLVDGAVLNNVPVDVMRTLVGGPTIGVDVSPTARLTFGSHHRQTVPSWQLLVRDLVPFRKRPKSPTVFSILHRTMLLHSDAQRMRARSQADLYLCPPLDQFDMFDWGSLEQIVELGYRHAAPEIAAWQRARLAQNSLLDSTDIHAGIEE